MGRAKGAAAAAAVLLWAGAAAAEPLLYRGGEIASDTAWSGEVRILGQTVVKRGATLTIEPGTTVGFLWSDDDGNGIGDGELKVEGRLVARGTAERPITFTSLRESPAAKDWTYVMVELGDGNVVEHCVFEHAFTGLQLHFCRAEVRRCLFRDNFEALRFSTADVVVEHNDMVGNRYGIRYESRGSEAVIARNRIVGNGYGFFPVVRSDSKVRIADNDIENGEYNVKMGEQQREDLDFRRNWWGTADRERIEAGLFDGRRDPSLGRVLYEPFLGGPVAGAGR